MLIKKSKYLSLLLRHRPMKRHHVHLSKDEATAVSVGKRNRYFALLEVDAKRAVSDGVLFSYPIMVFG